ncbi:MAG: hypothetical protein ACTSWP_03350 [Candidatus Freyarchaeota archaeon]|nr:hypothetical protein [Candidatus Freyrarchaeum guaymaensis]
MKGEATAIKSYKVPIEAPRDLIEAYFEAKKKALEEIMNHVTHSRTGKARLKFKAGDRRRLRNSLLKGWKYSKHYVDSAINSAIGLVKGWIKLYNKGTGEIQAQSNEENSIHKDNTIHVQRWKTKNQHQTKQTIPKK